LKANQGEIFCSTLMAPNQGGRDSKGGMEGGRAVLCNLN